MQPGRFFIWLEKLRHARYSKHMIGSLRGKIVGIRSGSFLLEVGGVGYLVRCSGGSLSKFKVQTEQMFYIHDHLREDSHDLFGFETLDEQDLFEQLLTVSGVGPKVALTILSAGDLDTVRRAVMQGDLNFLTSISGVGKKTAQKIILDLKGQIVEQDQESSQDKEALEALVSLGYSRYQAREALKGIPLSNDISSRIREALRILAK